MVTSTQIIAMAIGLFFVALAVLQSEEVGADTGSGLLLFAGLLIFFGAWHTIKNHDPKNLGDQK